MSEFESFGYGARFTRLGDSPYLTFDMLYGERIVQWTYWAGLVFIAFGLIAGMWEAFAITELFDGLDYYDAWPETWWSEEVSLLGACGVILGALGSLLAWRLTCELSVVLFKIHDALSRHE